MKTLGFSLEYYETGYNLLSIDWLSRDLTSKCSE